MAPLPSLSEVESSLDANGQSAWRRIVEAEKIASSANAPVTIAEYNNLLVGARVIGFFILDFKKHNHDISFAERAHRNLVQKVNSCWADPSIEQEECLKKVIDLGTLLQNHLIRAFRPNKSPNLTPFTPPYRPSIDIHKATILENLEVAPSSYSIAKEQALLRDGYRCCLSGLYDYESVQTWRALKAMAKEARSKYVRTKCCHIFSEVTLQSVGNGGNQDQAATAFAVLEMFGLQHLVRRLNGNGVHSLENVITMDMSLHRSFDCLELWLEPQPATSMNTYERQVILSVPDAVIHECKAKEKQIPALPDPDLIALHAACARVAYLSGAAEYFDMLERDAEDTSVLASDGSSASLLLGLLNLVPATLAIAA